ncbi:MAG TPA: SDR family oxidoreductase [Bacteroidota bacterium]|nr:SDR family oxidoreductase [Bacteroidota bacterium]
MPHALITGSAHRLGRHIALALADAGYDIVLHAHEAHARLAAVEEEVRARGREVFSVVADLRSVEEIRDMARVVAGRIERLDVLVNNAGVFPEAPFEEVTEDMWNLAVDVNTRAPFFLTQAVLPLLRAASGCVVNIVSAGAYEPWSRHIPYNISKAGAHMLTRALAKALAPDVRVNGIAPGIILMPEEEEREHIPATRFPLQRYGTAVDIAEAVLFLCERAPYITGHVLPVTGGAPMDR